MVASVARRVKSCRPDQCSFLYQSVRCCRLASDSYSWVDAVRFAYLGRILVGFEIVEILPVWTPVAPNWGVALVVAVQRFSVPKHAVSPALLVGEILCTRCGCRLMPYRRRLTAPTKVCRARKFAVAASLTQAVDLWARLSQQKTMDGTRQGR